MDKHKCPRLKPIDWENERDLIIMALKLMEEELNT